VGESVGQYMMQKDEVGLKKSEFFALSRS